MYGEGNCSIQDDYESAMCRESAVSHPQELTREVWGSSTERSNESVPLLDSFVYMIEHSQLLKNKKYITSLKNTSRLKTKHKISFGNHQAFFVQMENDQTALL